MKGGHTEIVKLASQTRDTCAQASRMHTQSNLTIIFANEPPVSLLVPSFSCGVLSDLTQGCTGRAPGAEDYVSQPNHQNRGEGNALSPILFFT